MDVHEDIGWEGRMAQRAAERARAMPEPDEHEGHHTHLRGSVTECSCGKFEGVICVVFPDEFWADQEAFWASISCKTCGQVGVRLLG